MNVTRFSTFFCALLACSSCRDEGNGGSTLAGARDGGAAGPVACTTTADCDGSGVCVAGLCEVLTTCAVASETTDCPPGQVCHSTRGYCVECDGRHAGECAADETCQFDFTCVAVESPSGPDAGPACSGTCTPDDRSECAADRVCRDGACCVPPTRCRGASDCPPDRPECNAATGECFGGDSCRRDADCSAAPGCGSGACRCVQSSPSSPGRCLTTSTECASDQDCAGGSNARLCARSTTPRRCVDARACTESRDCAADGLVCDLDPSSPTHRFCQNGTPCPTGLECDASGEACVDGVCVPQSCQTNPALCASDERCDPNSDRCVPTASGTCGANTDCEPGYYCAADGQCTVGCRDASDCPGGVCGARNQCEYPTGGICGSCASDADCPGGSNCWVAPLTMRGTCRESCSALLSDPCTANPGAQCILLKCSCVL